MFSFGLKKVSETAPVGPVLDLSGPRLRRAFENLVDSAESTGGVERYVSALALKASLFQEVLGKGRIAEMTESEFCDITPFMAPVRRRIGSWLGENKFENLRRQIEALLNGWTDISDCDDRIVAFVEAFPEGRDFRWTRDLAVEILHFVAPEHYPLMTRWIWDQKVGTGVVREIWHTDDIDSSTIEIGDGFAMHSMLRIELESFLTDNGVFRDLPFYVDLLCAHIYAGYINDRGGQYLRPDFCGDRVDGMLHTRRMLGLDAANTESARARLKLIDGKAHELGTVPELN